MCVFFELNQYVIIFIFFTIKLYIKIDYIIKHRLYLQFFGYSVNNNNSNYSTDIITHNSLYFSRTINGHIRKHFKLRFYLQLFHN